MSNTSSRSEDNFVPIFHFSPLSLQDLASIKTASQIWSMESAKQRGFPNSSRLQLALDELSDIPARIRKIIESRFNQVCSEIKFFFETVEKDLNRLSFDHVHEIRNRCDLLAFGGNGTIHFKDTIANFLEDDSLNVIVKFEMACLYCIEEKIDTFWHRMRYDRVIMSRNVDQRFESCFMMYYWIFQKEGTLNKIPLQGYRGIESFMIAKCCHKRYLLAIEYFLSLLEPNDRLVEINRLCESDAGYKCLRYLFPYLEASLQRRVLEKGPTRILIELIENYERIEYAIQCWFYVKDFITAEDYSRNVILHSIKYRNNLNDEFKYTQFEIFLTEIWSNTPDHLKQYTLQNHLTDILKELSLCRINSLSEFSRNVSFLLSILSDLDIRSRNSFWIKNWSNWISKVPPCQLIQLMKLCLPETEAMANFVGTFISSDTFQTYCDSLMASGYHQEMNEFLHDLNSNHEEVLELKKHLLMKCKTIFTKSHKILRKHAKFIDEVFPNETSAMFKDNLIKSREVVSLLCDQIERNQLNDVEIIVSLFVSTEKTDEYVKSKCLEALQDKLENGRLYGFEESSLENFLIWCFNNNHHRFEEFKKSLPINSIFEVASFKCLNFESCLLFNSGTCPCRTDDLLRFITWYFGSKSSRKFKLFRKEKTKYYQRMDEASCHRIFNKDRDTVVDFMTMGLWMNGYDDNDHSRGECAKFLKKTGSRLRKAFIRVCKNL